MGVETIIEDEGWDIVDLDLRAQVAATEVLRHVGLDPTLYEASVLGCNDARIADLNRDFRNKPQPTNVLSWPSEDRSVSGATPLPPQDTELGDIAIALETCVRQAETQGKTVADHVTHLLVHAMLHLLGYDHETEPDAAIMERIEVETLAKMGIADPY